MPWQQPGVPPRRDSELAAVRPPSVVFAVEGQVLCASRYRVGPVRPDVPDAHPPSLSLSDFTPRESEHPAARRAHIGNGTCSRVYSGHSSSVLSVRLPHTHGPVCPPRAVQYTLVPTCVYSVTAYPHQTPPQKHEWPRGANTTSDRPVAAVTHSVPECTRPCRFGNARHGSAPSNHALSAPCGSKRSQPTPMRPRRPPASLAVTLEESVHTSRPIRM